MIVLKMTEKKRGKKQHENIFMEWFPVRSFVRRRHRKRKLSHYAIIGERLMSIFRWMTSHILKFLIFVCLFFEISTKPLIEGNWQGIFRESCFDLSSYRQIVNHREGTTILSKNKLLINWIICFLPRLRALKQKKTSRKFYISRHEQ